MKAAIGIVAAALLLVGALVAPAGAGGYTYENRPEVVFKGGIVRQTPYPQSGRAAAVWANDTCWRDCRSSCSWKMEYCVRDADPDVCRPSLDACDRSCQRSCRAFTARPLLDFLDW